MNELPILACTQPPVLSENLVALNAQISDTAAILANAPQTAEGLQAVKAARAKLRKTMEAVEAQRKAAKAAIMEPYEAANRRYQETVFRPLDQADKECKQWIDNVQETMKQGVTAQLKAYFDELVTVYHIPWLTFDRCGVKVGMDTAKKVDFAKERKEVQAFVVKVREDLAAISEMEDSAAVLAIYTRTLDFTGAVREVQERKKLIAEAEQQRAEILADKQARETHADQLREMGHDLTPTPQDVKVECSFTVRATVPMLRALKIYLENNQFEIVEDTDHE